jgi:Protein of unknown function (DUF2613)
VPLLAAGAGLPEKTCFFWPCGGCDGTLCTAQRSLGLCRREEGLCQVSRLTLIIASLVVGAVLAVGATFATTALVSSSVTPSNQPAYNYGGN